MCLEASRRTYTQIINWSFLELKVVLFPFLPLWGGIYIYFFSFNTEREKKKTIILGEGVGWMTDGDVFLYTFN